MQQASYHIHFSQLFKNKDFFNSEHEKIKFDPEQPRSAVSIIIRKPSLKDNVNNKNKFIINDQILYLQRKISKKDQFSGQICFPGGRQQPGQSLLTTSIRQTYQQTNIKLQPHHLIGCISRHVNYFIPYKSKSQNEQKVPKLMIIYSFIFVISSDQLKNQTIKLNNEEMQKYKWVPVQTILSTKNLKWYDYTNRTKSLVTVYTFNKDIRNNIDTLKFVNRTVAPAFDLGMGTYSYGITMYITLIILTNIEKQIYLLTQQKNINLDSSVLYKFKQIICNLKEIKQKCQQHAYLSIDKPINQDFILLQNNLRNQMFKMRPKI